VSAKHDYDVTVRYQDHPAVTYHFEASDPDSVTEAAVDQYQWDHGVWAESVEIVQTSV
jgi:hypothetical protein